MRISNASSQVEFEERRTMTNDSSQAMTQYTTKSGENELEVELRISHHHSKHRQQLQNKIHCTLRNTKKTLFSALHTVRRGIVFV